MNFVKILFLFVLIDKINIGIIWYIEVVQSNLNEQNVETFNVTIDFLQ